MCYITETNKPFDQAAADLEAAVKQHGFGVLHAPSLHHATERRNHGIC